MLSALDVAKYYLSKDPEKKLFNYNVGIKNDRKFYEGNARLNKYLFLTQVVYLAKYEKKLFKDDFCAYANGPIVEDIMTNYGILRAKKEEADIPSCYKDFLDKIYDSLKDASYEELIDITHEDPEWIRLCNDTYNAPKMNLEKNIKEYKERYKGLIEALNL